MGGPLFKCAQCLFLSASLFIVPSIMYLQFSDLAYADKPAYIIEKKIEKDPVKNTKKTAKKAPEPAVWLLTASGIALLSLIHFRGKKKE